MHFASQSSRPAKPRRRRTDVGRRHAEERAVLVPIFIAYADVSVARHAMHELTLQLHQTHPGHQLAPMLWRFDQLDRPRWREMALADATRASAIVLALSDEVPLTAPAESWLTNLAIRHHGASIQVTAILNEELWTISLNESSTTHATHAVSSRPARKKKSPASLVALPDKNIAACAA